VADRDPGEGAAPSGVRRASVEDAAEIARLLHDFNAEFGEPTPPLAALTERLGELLGAGEALVLLAGSPPHGLALLRFRPSLWADGLEAYLEELYVAPSERGRGIGRALLDAAMEAARKVGATHFELTTGETDTAARGLYESAGLTNREGSPAGPRMLYYERDL
jgi:ribosomal protein S18 acetylase RimI-like enzyme